jgi:type II secretory pathway pseudopilin PulG
MNVGKNEILVGVAILVVGLLVVVPIFLGGGRSGALEEVRANVEAIRQAELQYQEAFGAYVSADAAPRPAHAVDPNAVPWAPSDGFRRLSWAPSTESVVGSYQIMANKQGFKVIGTADVDGDGQRAIFEATATEETHLVTGSGIY